MCGYNYLLKEVTIMIPESTISTNYISYESNSTSNGLDVSALGKDDFMRLLFAQLRNQDPLNPADNTEFVAQLAQFSTLEQVTLMNATLEKDLDSNTAMAEAVSNAMIINYFGKYVTAESDTFAYDGENPVELKFDFDSPVSSGELEIIDENGNVILSALMGAMDEGLNTLEWDGVTNLGVNAEPGVYSYNIKAYDSLAQEVGVSQMVTGIVKGISFNDGVTQLNIGGILVPFDKVRVITENE